MKQHQTHKMTQRIDLRVHLVRSRQHTFIETHNGCNNNLTPEVLWCKTCHNSQTRIVALFTVKLCLLVWLVIVGYCTVMLTDYEYDLV